MPTDASVCGKQALQSLPQIEQVFIDDISFKVERSVIEPPESDLAIVSVEFTRDAITNAGTVTIVFTSSAGDTFTIADIALFAYTHVADEGDFSLDNYPNVRAWIDRIRSRPNFVKM